MGLHDESHIWKMQIQIYVSGNQGRCIDWELIATKAEAECHENQQKKQKRVHKVGGEKSQRRQILKIKPLRTSLVA